MECLRVIINIKNEHIIKLIQNDVVGNYVSVLCDIISTYY